MYNHVQPPFLTVFEHIGVFFTAITGCHNNARHQGATRFFGIKYSASRDDRIFVFVPERNRMARETKPVEYPSPFGVPV
jgi:hypothetical protein